MGFFKFVAIGMLMMVHLYAPKFKAGDCISADISSFNEFNGTVHINHRVKQVGKRTYWLEGEDVDDYHFDVSYIDSEYEKVDCGG